MRSRSRLVALLAFAAALTGACGWFLTSTSLIAVSPPRTTMFVALAGLFICGAATRLQSLRDAAFKTWIQAGIGGAMAFWAAPALVLTQRTSDTPSGSETLFFSVVAFGLIACVASYAIGETDRSSPVWTGIFTVGVGALGVLSNWERPSSFSPLVKFPEREGIMLVAGVMFAVGTVMILRAAGRDRGEDAVSVAFASALAVGTLVALPALAPSVVVVRANWPLFLLAGLSYGLFGAGWLHACRLLGMARASSALAVAPAALTSLILAERLMGVRGPDPIVWMGAGAGIALSVTGAAAALLTASEASSADKGRARMWWIGPLAAVFAVLTLGLPAISQSAQGVTSSGEAFRASWVLPGLRSAGGWSVLAAGLCALGVGLTVKSCADARRSGGVAVAGITAAVATVFMRESSLATWNSWVPAEVQQAYGTEYALLTVSAVHQPLRYAGAAFSAVAIVVVVTIGIIDCRRRRESEDRGTA